MNKKEFVQWLEQFPDDTIIRVVVGVDVGCYSGPHPEVQNFDVGNTDQWDFYDFTDNPFVKPSAEHFSKKYLELGAK